MIGFADRTVELEGHAYTLDLHPLNGALWIACVAVAVALLVILAVARSFDRRSAPLAVGWATLGLAWLGGYAWLEWVPLGARNREGHVYKLFWPQLRQVAYLDALATWLTVLALAALILTRPAAGTALPPQKQLQPLWPRAIGALVLLIFWGLAMQGVAVLHRYAALGHVVVVNQLDHPRVHVGQPVTIEPEIRFVGLQTHSFFWSKSRPVYLKEEARSLWSIPSEPLIAKQPGRNRFPFRMVRKRPYALTVETTLQLEAGEERGNPLWPLHVGDAWRYRVAGPARNEAQLVEQFRRDSRSSPAMNGGRAVRAKPVERDAMLMLRVDDARVEAGVRHLTLVAEWSGDAKASPRSYDLTMWDGETYVEQERTRVPLLTRSDGAAAPGESLFACAVHVLPGWDRCLCSAQPLDAQRRLPGPARCIESRVRTHDGHNLMVLGLGFLTLGLTSLGPGGLRLRDSERYAVGLLQEESGAQ